ncbi:MAG: DUF1295 domain-containing protein [Candidatus Heimdallarchaeaceae archaeon]
MDKKDIKSLIATFIALAIGTGISFAGSADGRTIFGGFPLFAFCIIIIFAIQWLAFIPAYIFKTEKFFDLTGAVTYVVTIVLAFVYGAKQGILQIICEKTRSFVIMVIVVFWAVRLGHYLFMRVLNVGEDKRFDNIKNSFARFLMTWTLQGLWVSLTLAAALAAITIEQPANYDTFDLVALIVGGSLWLIGFGFEAIGDYQKGRFRADPENKGKFIKTGLWKVSRHPNYFGEIVIWIGMALIVLPTLASWRFITLISPIYVILQLTLISGVNMLEKRADQKWGGQEDYEEYKKKTPALIPWIHFKK